MTPSVWLSMYRASCLAVVSCILATLLSTRLSSGSIYTIKLLRRGVNILAGQDVNLLRGFRVRDVMRAEPPTVSPRARLGKIAARLADGQASTLYVVGEGGRLQGVVSMGELQPHLADLDVLRDLVTADEIAQRDALCVAADATLDEVLEKLDVGYRDELPVVDGDLLVGVVRIEDVLRRYKRELLRRELEQLEDRQGRAAARGRAARLLGRR